jgi:YgiT-type zinc finger domain-containing protein
MICLICRQAHIVHGFTSIHFERDEFRAVVHHVPAQVCPACGEAFLSEPVTAEVLQQVEQVFLQGEIESVQDFA